MARGRRNVKRKSTGGSHKSKKALHTKKRVHVPHADIRDRWDHSLTLKQNYQKLGLLGNPNAKQKAAEEPVELNPGEKKKKEPYLTTAEIICYRELIKAHALDYDAMFRDIKRNPYQHGKATLQKKCELYMEKYAYRDDLFVEDE